MELPASGSSGLATYLTAAIRDGALVDVELHALPPR